MGQQPAPLSCVSNLTTQLKHVPFFLSPVCATPGQYWDSASAQAAGDGPGPGAGGRGGGRGVMEHDRLLPVVKRHTSPMCSPSLVNVSTRHTTAADSFHSPSCGRRAEDRLLCVCCQEHERAVVLLPCRHWVLCRECARAVAKGKGGCPICRAAIQGRERVSLA